MKILALTFFLICFQAFSQVEGAVLNFHFSFDNNKIRFKKTVLDVISKESTEAVFSFDGKKLEFCCEREQTSEPFFEMSEEQSARIVQSFLGPKNNKTPLRPKPKKGQR